MTSDRHLALMDLMREIEQPSAVYRRSVRLAASTATDTPANSRAIDSGKQALDDIEQAVRRWTAEHPEHPEKPLPAGFRRDTVIAVKCAVCEYEYDEDESYTVHFDSVKQATDAVRDAGWTALSDGRVLCQNDDPEHQALLDALMPPEPVTQTPGQIALDGSVHTGPVCDEMNHNSVGSEIFCQLASGHHADHDDDNGTTWPRED